MYMQQLEQSQPSGQEWQASQEYTQGAAEDNYQQQKIYPQQAWRPRGKALAILGIVISAMGFFTTLAGIILSAIVLRYAHGRPQWLAGGAIGLAGSIVVMLGCIAIYVIAMIVLTKGTTRIRRRKQILRTCW